MTPTIRFVEPVCELVREPDLVRKVELAYRVCYKSESKISESSKILVQRLASSRGSDRHTSPLEHAWIKVIPPIEEAIALQHLSTANKYISSRNNVLIGNFRAFHDLMIHENVEGSLSRINGTTALHALFYQLHIAYPEVFPELPGVYGADGWVIEEYDKYSTFKIVTSRDILQELVRHRTMSFSVESTRYCNYGNRGYEFVIPRPYEWANGYDWEHPAVTDSSDMRDLFIENCLATAWKYDTAIKNGTPPQEARMLLPGALKTELYMTGTDKQWEQFLILRDSKLAHPMIQYLAQSIKKQLTSSQI